MTAGGTVLGGCSGEDRGPRGPVRPRPATKPGRPRPATKPGRTGSICPTRGHCRRSSGGTAPPASPSSSAGIQRRPGAGNSTAACRSTRWHATGGRVASAGATAIRCPTTPRVSETPGTPGPTGAAFRFEAARTANALGAPCTPGPGAIAAAGAAGKLGTASSARLTDAPCAVAPSASGGTDTSRGPTLAAQGSGTGSRAGSTTTTRTPTYHSRQCPARSVAGGTVAQHLEANPSAGRRARDQQGCRREAKRQAWSWHYSYQ